MKNIRPCLIEPPIDIQASYEAAIKENPTNALSTSPGRGKRAVGAHTKFWRPGRTLIIAIPRYDEAMFQAVKAAASKWLPRISLKFEFIEWDEEDENLKSDIRVYFHPSFNETGASKVGTDALTVSPFDNTMSLGTDYTSAQYESTVLHEFGHVLGLLHEHQHPDANIPWDKEATYNYFEKRFGWSREIVDMNIFPIPRDPNTSYAPYDRHSIMHYPVLKECAIDNWEQTANLKISTADMAFAYKIYP